MILNPNHLIFISLDSLFNNLSMYRKIVKFHHHLTPQFNV